MSQPKALAAGGVLLALVLLVAGFVLFRSSDSDNDALAPMTTVDNGSEEAAGPDASVDPDDPDDVEEYRAAPWALIATLDEDIPSFDEPSGMREGMVPATWHDRVSALAVIEERPGWLQVRLPERPNGSTTWIRRRDVEVTRTPYRIRIDVATMRLELYEQGELVLDAPAGIGTDEAPTTVGEFFLTFLQEPFDDGGNWGPFIMVTSAHSETISDYQQSGDAIAAIHGPLGAADKIGDTGAKVSNGCVRLHVDDLKVLRDVPVGSPIDITDFPQTGTTT